MANVYPIPASLKDKAYITKEKYAELYRRSLTDSDNFWAEQAEHFISWDKKWNKITEANFTTGDAKWFIGGKLNLSVNCIDRHLPQRANQTAIIWEGDLIWLLINLAQVYASRNGWHLCIFVVEICPVTVLG